MFIGDYNLNNIGATNMLGTQLQQRSTAMAAPTLAPVPATGIQVGQMAQPQAAGGGMFGGNSNNGLGFNLGTGQLLLGGVQAIGNLWNAWQTQQLAREQFDFTKGITNTNLANQIQTFNTSLSDRMHARGAMQSNSPEEINRYIEENRLTDRR